MNKFGGNLEFELPNASKTKHIDKHLYLDLNRKFITTIDCVNHKIMLCETFRNYKDMLDTNWYDSTDFGDIYYGKWAFDIEYGQYPFMKIPAAIELRKKKRKEKISMESYKPIAKQLAKRTMPTQIKQKQNGHGHHGHSQNDKQQKEQKQNGHKRKRKVIQDSDDEETESEQEQDIHIKHEQNGDKMDENNGNSNSNSSKNGHDKADKNGNSSNHNATNEDPQNIKNEPKNGNDISHNGDKNGNSSNYNAVNDSNGNYEEKMVKNEPNHNALPPPPMLEKLDNNGNVIINPRKRKRDNVPNEDFLENYTPRQRRRGKYYRDEKLGKKKPKKRADIIKENAESIGKETLDDMKRICTKLGILEGCNIGCNLYFFKSYYDVYKCIEQLFDDNDIDEFRNVIENKSQSFCRDIKYCLHAKGPIVPLKTMQENICRKFNELKGKGAIGTIWGDDRERKKRRKEREDKKKKKAKEQKQNGFKSEPPSKRRKIMPSSQINGDGNSNNFDSGERRK